MRRSAADAVSSAVGSVCTYLLVVAIEVCRAGPAPRGGRRPHRAARKRGSDASRATAVRAGAGGGRAGSSLS